MLSKNPPEGAHTRDVSVTGSTALSTKGDSSATPASVYPKEEPTSIEQSVKMFKIFDVLRNGDSAAVEKAVRGSIKDQSALGGTTILHLAVQCAQPAVVEQVISHTASASRGKTNINVQDKDGNTPLHLAASMGRPNVVRVLLAQKTADSSILNFQGRSALELAKTPEIFQQLQYDRAIFIDQQVKQVQHLIATKDYEGLENLLEDPRVTSVIDVNGAELASEPNTVESGGSLLHEAARRRDIKIIQLLLLHGADPFRRDRRGKLPQDVTKDDRTRSILKKSPAATAAQRGIQEKAILGGTGPDSKPGGKESREIKGYLKKWTNYTSGYKLRWFVLEDGVLSYYKHQDDAGSACRGAMNMRIAKLSMDSSTQDKTRFEIQGKSSVKYHLKANHSVEAKRWFWALNNAIQWAKDEIKEEKRATKETEAARLGVSPDKARESASFDVGSRSLAPSVSHGPPSGLQSSTSLQPPSKAGGSIAGDEQGSVYSLDASVANGGATRGKPAGGVDEAHDGEDASSHDVALVPKDAFNITAHSAYLQLDILSQVAAALSSKAQSNPETTLAESDVATALSTYEGAVSSLKSMVSDLLKIARDRDSYWQYRLDREADLRRLWEESMANVAREQEELEGRIGESEEKRKLTKKALKEALEDSTYISPGKDGQLPSRSPTEVADAISPRRRGSIGSPDIMKKSAIAQLDDMSDSASDDEEFFDAVGAGEIRVEVMPQSPRHEKDVPALEFAAPTQEQDSKMRQIEPSYKGYEDPVRTRLTMDADERPKISLWVCFMLTSLEFQLNWFRAYSNP